MAVNEHEIRRKLRILDHAVASGDGSRTYQYFGIGTAILYLWRHTLADHGEAGLANKRSVPHNYPNRTNRLEAHNPETQSYSQPKIGFEPSSDIRPGRSDKECFAVAATHSAHYGHSDQSGCCAAISSNLTFVLVSATLAARS